LLVAAESGHVTESAAARLRAYGAGLDRQDFAICAGSIGLTMADSSVRHGRLDEAASAVPRSGEKPGARPGPRRRVTIVPCVVRWAV
jgi:hypothetical protein